ncbi:MAG: hypothetical protein FWF29_08355 [Treponema sp.]|nr:hypothetical protein [Treponema sp.]
MKGLLVKHFTAGLILPVSIIALVVISACSGPASTNTTDTGKKYSIIKGTHEYGDFSVSPAGPYTQGTVVTLEPIAAANYVFSEWNLSPAINPEENPAGSGKWTFTIPARDVTVNATFIHKSQIQYTITKGTHANGDFTINPSAPQQQGTPILLLPQPSGDNYKFSSWECTPASVVPQPHTTPGEWYFLMPSANVTINAIFVSDDTPPVTSGTITVTAPVAGATAPKKETSANTGASNFTGILSDITGGLLQDGTAYMRKTAYSFVYTLTPKTGYRFVSTTNITVAGAEKTEYTYIRADSATVTVTFPRTVAWPGTPDAVDLAFGKGAAAVASDQSGYNAPAVASNPFDGTSYLLTDTATTVWQADGTSTAHWLAVDLGAVYDLGTVLVTWGPGDSRLWDGMAAGDIQVASAKPDPDADPAQMDDPYYDPAFYKPFMTAGNYSDYAWTTVGTWKNNDRNSPDVDLVTIGTNTRDRNLPWLNRIDLPAGTKGRYIRVKATDPLTNPPTWTSWPRISMLEVYDKIIAAE